MRMEQANHLLALSSSTSVKGKMSKLVTEKVVNKSLLKKTYVKPTTQAVNTVLMKHIEDVVGPATHLSLGISRSSPLFNPTGKLGEQHVVCAPNRAAVTETLEAFQKQQSNFSRATFIVNDMALVKKNCPTRRNGKVWIFLKNTRILLNLFVSSHGKNKKHLMLMKFANMCLVHIP
jgi:hypothetical protein